MASEQFQVVLKILARNQAAAAAGGEPDLATRRAAMEAQAATPPADIAVEQGALGGRPVEWVSAPGSDPQRALLYLHGGGYCLGSPATHRDLAGRIARAAGLRVAVLDYRLAPEHRFPAAVDDATAAYRELLAAGFAPANLAIAGDSAGGGLTVATLLALRDAGEPLPAAAALISPWVDLACTGASFETRKQLDPIIQGREGIDAMARAYLGGADPRHPLASPLYADLHGLPRLLIHVGEAEVLFDDAARIAARACEAGVPVVFEPWPEMIHVWHAFAPILPEGQEAIERVGAFLRGG